MKLWCFIVILCSNLRINAEARGNVFGPTPLINHLNCSIQEQKCSWQGSDQWYYQHPDNDNILLLNGPPPGQAALVGYTRGGPGEDEKSLTSPAFSIKKVSCFEFTYYFMTDDPVDTSFTLSLLDHHSSLLNRVWATGNDYVDQWHRVKVRLEKNESYSGDYRLQFKAILSPHNMRGYVALQDLVLRDDQECQYDSLCTFDSDSCGWSPTNEANEGYGFLVYPGVLSQLRDHTTRSLYGQFVYLPPFAQPYSTSLWRSPSYNINSVQCFSFWFLQTHTAQGIDTSLIGVPKSAHASQEMLWKNNKTEIANEWIYIAVTVDFSRIDRVYYLAKNKDKNSGIGIDDIKLTPGVCPSMIDCSFDGNTCGWLNEEKSAKSNAIWSVGRGRVFQYSKLSFSKLPDIGTVLYSDFTTIENGDKTTMELKSEYIQSPPKTGGCFQLQKVVKSFDVKTDKFELVAVDINKGKEYPLWSHKPTDDEEVDVFVPQGVASRLFRFVLRVVTPNPATYVMVTKVKYRDTAYPCRGAPPTSRTTVEPTVAPKASLDTDFEHGFGNWMAIGDTFRVGKAKANNAPEAVSLDIPPVDATTNSIEGHFLYLAGQGNVKGSIKGSNAYKGMTVCVTFAYYFSALEASSFTFSTSEDANPSSVLFQSFNANLLRWQVARFTIRNITSSYIYFNGDVTDGALSIDDIRFKEGPCSDNNHYDIDCSFETGSACDFEPVFEGGHIYWQVYQAGALSIFDMYNPNAKLRDHTTRSTRGHVYGLDLSAPELKSASASVQEFVVQSKAALSSCVRFAYMINNISSDVYLAVTANAKDSGNVLNRWTSNEETDGYWFQAELPYSGQKSSVIKFSIHEQQGGSRAGTSKGLVFIDDVHFSASARGCPYRVDQCNFENGDTCLMETVPRSPDNLPPDTRKARSNVAINTSVAKLFLLSAVDVVWHVYTPKLGGRSGFIDKDYDQNANGYYLLLRGDRGDLAYSRGIMITEQYRMNRRPSICFSFGLIKPTADTVFEIYQAETKMPSKATKVWETRRTYSQWERIQLEVQPRAHSTIVYFYLVGTIQPGRYLGLDNIKVTHSSCETTPASPTPPTNETFECASNHKVISLSKVCDWVKDCPQNEDERNCGDCDFARNDLCGYQIASTYPNFSFNFSGDNHINDLPISMSSYIVTSGNGFNGVTELISPTIHRLYNSISCNFKFSYMFFPKGKIPVNSKNDLGYTNVYLYLDYLDIDEKILLWQSNWQLIKSKEWMSQHILLTNLKHTVRFRFTTESNPFNLVRHALAEFQLSQCEPVDLKTDPGSCGVKYSCDGGRTCYDELDRCDLLYDCDDQSDEMNCDPSRRNTFELGTNDWLVQSNWKVDSSRVRTSSKDLISKPSYDHTTFLSYGHYLLATFEAENAHNSSYAVVRSPPVKVVQGGKCALMINYMKRINEDTPIEIVLRNLDTGKEQVLHSLFGDTNSWSFILTHIYDVGMFSILIKVTIPRPSREEGQYFAAIDDVAFVGKACTIVDGYTPKPNDKTTPPPDGGCPTATCLTRIGGKNFFTKRICLKDSQLCNGVKDCLDGSDEKDCGGCNFDQGTTCRWVKIIGPAEEKVVMPASQGPKPLPSLDANQNKSGGYLAFWGAELNTQHDTYTKIRSPFINAKTLSTCTFTFQMFSTRESEAIVSVFHNDMGQVLASFSGDTKRWVKREVMLGAREPPFAVQIMVKSDGVYQNWELIVVDNFQLADCYRGKNNTLPVSDTLTCNFEKDLCGWGRAQEEDDGKNWVRTNEPKVEPGHDHTCMVDGRNAQHSGYWMSSQEVKNDNEVFDVLVSRKSIDPSKTYCLSFWYYFYGLQLNYFVVAKSSKKDSFLNQTSLWARTVPEARNWRQGRLEIAPAKEAYYLKFIAFVLPSTVAGLDDIVFTEGVCTADNFDFCDLEVNTCSWRAQRPNSWTLSHGQVNDHTTGTVSGHYLSAGQKGVKQVLTTKLSNWTYLTSSSPLAISRPKPMCLQFYYYLQHDPTVKIGPKSQFGSQLTINNQISVDQDTIMMTDVADYQQLNQWNLYRLTYHVTRLMQLSIATMVDVDKLQFLVDDIRLLPHECEEHGNCDFEQDMCGWQNAHSIQQNKHTVLWIRVNPYLQYFKGSRHLTFDHTTLSYKGNYLLLTVDMFQSADAILVSPVLRRAETINKICFRMFYFALMRKVDTLMQLRFVDLTVGGRNTELITDIKGWNDMMWHELAQEFDDLPQVFAFKIVSNSSQSLVSDIGIDDITITKGSCSGGGSTTSAPPQEIGKFRCGFEQHCNWAWNAKGWMVTSAVEQHRNKNYYAPMDDHNEQLAAGKYLMFNENGVMQTSYKIEMTQPIEYINGDDTYCLRFWYYEDGENEFTLSIVMETAANETRTLNRYTSTLESKRWKVIVADVPWDTSIRDKTIKLSIVYSPGRKQFFSVFALDDIEILKGVCPHQHDFTYTFAGGLDNLQLLKVAPAEDTTTKEAARVFNCKTKTSGETVPGFDHTTYSNNGAYFLFQAPKKAPASLFYRDALFLRDVPQDVSGQLSCIRFAYQYTGNVSLALKIRPENSFQLDDISTLWSLPKYPKTTWTIAEVNTFVGYLHQVVFDMSMTADHESADEEWLAIDDVKISGSECQKPLSCNFEGGQSCSYTLYKDDETDPYAFGVVSTPSPDPDWPGPRYDHTRHAALGGSYLYLTDYRTRDVTSGIVSKLISGVQSIEQGKSYCLSFWYQMSTSDISLVVSLIRYGPEFNSANELVGIFHRTDQATTKQWNQVLVNMDSEHWIETAEEVQLLIEGRIDSGSKGFIAIDDILLDQGACPKATFACENGLVLNISQVCDFVKDCPSGLDEIGCGDCSFENDNCGWSNVENQMSSIEKSLKFDRVKASKASNPSTAPKVDGDGNAQGHYLLAYKKASVNMFDAQLALNYETVGNYLKKSSKTCQMHFDYNIYHPKPSTPTYRVRVQIGEVVTRTNTLYHIEPEASYTSGWRRAVVYVGEKFSPYLLMFSAHLGSAGAWMAIDNVQMTNCTFPAVTRVEDCADSGQAMLCPATGYCTNKDELCDLKNDCGDGWDEQQSCPTILGSALKDCSFEYGFNLCSITPSSSRGANFAWRISEGKVFHKYGPSIDSTTRTNSGKFYLMKKIRKVGGYQNGTSFTTQMLTSSANAGCRCRFFYYTDGELVNVTKLGLDVYVRYADKTENEKTPIYSAVGNAQQRWIKVVVKHKSSNRPFQFVFYGHQADMSSRLAIDDISFDTKTCFASKVLPPTGKPTHPTQATPSTTSPSVINTSTQPPVDRKSQPRHKNNLPAIIIPIVLVVTVIGAYFGYQRYRKYRKRDDNIVLSMSSLQHNYH